MDLEGVGIVILFLPPIPIAAIPLGVPIAVFFPTYQYKQYQPCEKKGGDEARNKKNSNAKGNLIYLDDSRTSNNIVISRLLISLSQDDVALSGNAFGNSDGELSITDRLERSPDRAGDGDEGSVDIAGAGVETGTSHQMHLRTCHDGVHRAHCECREGLYGQRAVTGRARGNEGRSDGVHLVEAERVVEGLGKGDFADRGAQVRAVSGFCGENAAGSRQVGVAHDRGCGSEVSADSDTWRGY